MTQDVVEFAGDGEDFWAPDAATTNGTGVVLAGRKSKAAKKMARARANPGQALRPKPGELAHGLQNNSDQPERVPQEVFAAEADSFAALGISSALSTHLAASGFAAPTQVQQEAIPLLLVSQLLRIACLVGRASP